MLALTAIAITSHAYTNTTLNITACGGTLSGGGYTHIGSFVSVGGQNSKAGSLYHYSGFAAGFVLQPATATAGLPDELNPDNDQDGLIDDEEVAAGSSLYNSDTDGDGQSDLREWIAGTSPINPTSLLTAYLTVGSSINEISWHGVLGRYYQLEYTDSLTNDWTPIGVIHPGADAPIKMIDDSAGSEGFYRIRVSKNPSEF